MAEITLLTNWKILWGLTASKINESNCVTIKVWVSLPLSRHILHLGKQVRDSNPKFLDDYLPNSQPTTRISICLKIFLHTKLVFPFFTQNVSVKGVFKNCGGIFRNQSNTHFFKGQIIHRVKYYGCVCNAKCIVHIHFMPFFVTVKALSVKSPKQSRVSQ